jgi:hypothetical protein
VPTAAGQVVFNNLAFFQKQFVARDIALIEDQQTRLKIHVEQLTAPSSIDLHLFTPPANAKKLKQAKVSATEAQMQSSLQKDVPPIYPASAKKLGISDTVVLKRCSLPVVRSRTSTS